MPVHFVDRFSLLSDKKAIPCKVDLTSRRRYFPKTEQDTQEMEWRSGHFDVLPNELQHEILSYVPTSCDSKKTISSSTKGLIQYSHVSSKTKRAVEALFSRRMHQTISEGYHTYHFVKNPKLRIPYFRNILINKKKIKEMYENPEDFLIVFDVVPFCKANGYAKPIDPKWCAFDLIEFFCDFVTASDENKEIAFQFHLNQLPFMTEREIQIERRAFDVILFMMEKAVYFSIEKINLSHETSSVRNFSRMLNQIFERQNHFFNHKIVPLLNF